MKRLSHLVSSFFPGGVLIGSLLIAMIAVVGCDSGGGMEEEEQQQGETNNAPTAQLSVSPASPVETGTEIALDASSSSDADGDAVTFRWSLSAPSGSGVTLSDTSGTDVHFTPDVDGDYTATVMVSDDKGDSDDASVTVTAEQPSVVEVSSNITSNTTWKASSIYRVTRVVEVTDNATLTIEPGTRIEFQADAGLTVNGNGSALVAEGTADDSILMTGTQSSSGFWTGIGFYSSNSKNAFDYVTVEYAGSQDLSYLSDVAAVALDNDSKLKLSNTTITHSGAHGLLLDADAELTTFANNTFKNNTTAPVRIPSTQIGVLDAGSNFTGNEEDYVEVYGRTVTSDVTVTALNVPYHMFGSTGISGTTTFTIAEGVTMAFNADASLQVTETDAALVSQGTSANRVTLTGVQQADGAWPGIAVYSANPNNSLTYTDIEYGGSADFSYISAVGAVALDNGAQLSITNSSVSGSGGYGVHLDAGAHLPGFQNNTIENNTEAPVRIPATALGDLDSGSTFANNSNAFISVYNRDVTSDVTVQPLDVPYRMSGFTEIQEDALLTVSAGVTMEFTANAGMAAYSSNSALSIEGTSSNRVTLTGVQKPADGGYWNGIGFYSPDTRNKVLYADIEYAGADGLSYIANPTNVAVESGARLTIENSSLNHSGGYGGWADDGTNADVTYSNNSYTGNDSADTNWK